MTSLTELFGSSPEASLFDPVDSKSSNLPLVEKCDRVTSYLFDEIKFNVNSVGIEKIGKRFVIVVEVPQFLGESCQKRIVEMTDLSHIVIRERENFYQETEKLQSVDDE